MAVAVEGPFGSFLDVRSHAYAGIVERSRVALLLLEERPRTVPEHTLARGFALVRSYVLLL